MTHHNLGVSLFALVLLTACTASPKVTYTVQDAQKPDPSGQTKFVLSRSLIHLDRQIVKDQPMKLVATSVPTELPTATDGTSPLYILTPDSQFGVDTRLNITYIENTRLISSVGVEIQDNRIKTIGEIAGIAVAVAPLLLSTTTAALPPKLPIVIDPNAYERSDGGKWVNLPENDGWVYKLKIDKAAADSVDTKEFFTKYAKGTEVLPYAACRKATLYVLQTDKKLDAERDRSVGDGFVFELTLADPERVLTVKLPAKGKIDMHTSCGANVTNDKTDTASTWAVLGEVAKQAAAIKKAYDVKAAAEKK